MGLGDIVYKYLPVSFFKFARHIYYKVNSSIYNPLDEEQFKSLLYDKMGVKDGMVLYIHSSIDKLNIRFSPYVLLKLLLEVVGDEGTLVFPCWHYLGRAEDYLKRNNAVFNVVKFPSTLGLLTELARRYKNSVRSLHPTASTVAIGAKAKEIVSEHHLDIYPNGKKSPLFKIMNYNSRIIGLGEKVVSLSFVHVVEDVLKDDFPIQTLTDKPVKAITVDENNKYLEIETLVPHKNIANRNATSFFNKYITKDACYSFSYKGVNYFSANPNQLFQELKNLAIQGKTIYGLF